MSDLTCLSCRKPKTVANCSICEGALCKTCITYHDPAIFSFLKEVPEELAHPRYCAPCYDEQVAPALESYQEIMNRAQQVFVFFTTQRKGMPLTGKSKLLFRVKDCPDRDETIMRLAFFAAEAGYNALIETDVASEKVRNGKYQKSNWHGQGVPAQVDASKIDRDDALHNRYK